MVKRVAGCSRLFTVVHGCSLSALLKQSVVSEATVKEAVEGADEAVNGDARRL